MKGPSKHYHYSIAKAGRSVPACRMRSKLGADAARKVGKALAQCCGATVHISNPTLVHHGWAQGATYHLFTKAGAPLADLYVGEKAATAVAHALANHMGTPMHLVENDEAGKRGNAAFSKRESPFHGSSERDVALRSRRNPSCKPIVGSTWSRHDRGPVKIETVTRSRIHVKSMRTGNREWIDAVEFCGTFKPGRSVTQNRTPRKRVKRKRTARKRPSLKRKRPNPRSAGQRAQAEATFKKWHEFGSSKVTRMKGPGRVIPKTLVHLGKLISVVYESDKYTGKPTLYEHKTKRPHPVLASDPAGRHVHIVGGRMKITGDGLVN